MKRHVVIAAIAAAVFIVCSTAFAAGNPTPKPFKPHHCRIIGEDAAVCFDEPFIADAYSTFEGAEANYRSLPSPKYLVSTNDQTRKFLVVHEWDYQNGPLPNGSRDGYVTEFYANADDLDKAVSELSDDQVAGAHFLDVPPVVLGGGTLLIYRTFNLCGAGR
jgi:hypothetical protein